MSGRCICGKEKCFPLKLQVNDTYFHNQQGINWNRAEYQQSCQINQNLQGSINVERTIQENASTKV